MKFINQQSLIFSGTDKGSYFSITNHFLGFVHNLSSNSQSIRCKRLWFYLTFMRLRKDG